jgi:hypothetical protein
MKTMKYRKPRFSKRRIEAAEQYIKVSSDFIRDGISSKPIDQDAAARNVSYKKNKKILSVGKEFITDLLLWQRSQLEANCDNDS